jgi:hypothetical protein
MIAAARVRDPGILDLLKRWAEAKFKIPWSHEVFQGQTILELLVDFWEDYYLENKIASRTTETGQVVFSNTGDALIDKWEQEIAMGLEPDLLEGVSPEERAREEAAMERLKKQQLQIKEIDDKEGFSEDYSTKRSELPTLGG